MRLVNAGIYIHTSVRSSNEPGKRDMFGSPLSSAFCAINLYFSKKLWLYPIPAITLNTSVPIRCGHETQATNTDVIGKAANDNIM